MKIKDLKQGQRFRDEQGTLCMVIESNLEMGELPYVVLEGKGAGETGYYDADNPRADREISL